ncbi:P-type conjugative transfer protein TrbJ [Sphingomonas zeicaulis]|uniref:P-type conjugative transfer protein TrbJ n=1 Tax=Sphingomonas zeicaulis TaxID=1632740 RepID=UPI003D19EF4C
MNKRLMSCLLTAGAIMSGACAFIAQSPPAQALPVFDSANYAQNLLTAARTLQQINQQIQSLQNEAAMIANMDRNLERIDFPQLDQITQSLVAIDRLMREARGIDFDLDQLETRFRAMFPGSFDAALRTDDRVREARQRLDTAMSGYRHAMTVQAQVVEDVRADAQALADIVGASQNASGSLQAAQATNQLLALTAKQQLQLQQMMAAQYRSETLDRARRTQAEREAKDATTRFLGDGRAYTPR